MSKDKTPKSRVQRDIQIARYREQARKKRVKGYEVTRAGLLRTK